MHSARHYRERAVEVRRLADSVLDAKLQDRLMAVAREYDDMALHLDGTSRPHDEKPDGGAG